MVFNLSNSVKDKIILKINSFQRRISKINDLSGTQTQIAIKDIVWSLRDLRAKSTEMLC